MEYTYGEIIVSPKTIFWVEIPFLLNENDRIDLLKRDILLLNYNGLIKDIIKLKEIDNKFSGYFFNFDGILSKNFIKHNAVNPFAEKIAQFINKYFKRRSLVYTKLLDKKLVEIFKKYGIAFLEKNLSDKKIALTTVYKLIHPFFAENNKVQRSYLRLNLYPMKYNIVLTNFSKKNLMVTGILRDLSMNGMGMIVIEEDKVKQFNLKDIVEVKVSIKNKTIKVAKAIIARLDISKSEVCITYDINNYNMIEKENSYYLTNMIYNWLKEIINEFGSIKLTKKSE
jgi:hypothetical protein